MIIKIRKNKTSPEFRVEIPSSVNINELSIGEKFTVFLFAAKENKEFKLPIEACFLADKRSILVQDDIIRIPKLKKLTHLQTHIIRPVEPKNKPTNKALGELKSPMTGKIISIEVKEDDFVQEGDTLIIIEAMKMENRILAEGVGIVKNIKVSKGTNITAGDALLTLTEKLEL